MRHSPLLEILSVALSLPYAVPAAVFQGSDLDGNSYNCTAYSYSTGHYYSLTCEFSGDEIILYFPKGGHIAVTMDDEEIDDPSSISAYDYNKGNYWDVEVDDLE